MPIARVNGIELWYELRGPASAPTLVLSHGWRGPTDDWPPGVIEALAEQLRVLVYDVRGHGLSEAPEDLDAYSMPAYAADLRALLDALEIDRAHIGGVSQGGMIAAQFAADYPERVRSLIISDSTAGNGVDEGPAGEWERTLQRAFEVMEAIAREKGLRRLAEILNEWDRRDAHYYDHPEAPEVRDRKNVERHLRMSLAAFVGTSRAIRDRPDLTARLREVQAPALVMVGEWDGFRPCAERDHRLLEDSRFVLVRNSGHGTPGWRPETFVRAVLDFIADVEAGRDVAGQIEL